MTAIVDTNYVLNIYIQNIKVQKQICCIDQNHETCISFKFLEKIEFDICVANDPRLKPSCPCIIKFEKGKTCMFLMNAELAKKANDLHLYMEVTQRMPCACLPSKLRLGNTKVDLSDQFTKVNAGESKPILQYVAVKDADGDEIAVVDMMIRVSKLNKINFNDFTMNDEGNKFMVKGNDDPQSYMFKRAAGIDMGSTMGQEKGSGCCSDRQHLQSSHRSFVGGGGAGGMWDDGFGRTGGGGSGGVCCGGGGAGFTGGKEFHGPAGTCSHPTGGCGCFVPKKTYDENFDQVDMTVAGNNIIIKVPKVKEPEEVKLSFFDYPRPVIPGAVIKPAVRAVAPAPAPVYSSCEAPDWSYIPEPAPVAPPKPATTKVASPVMSGMMAALPVRVPSPPPPPPQPAPAPAAPAVSPAPPAAPAAPAAPAPAALPAPPALPIAPASTPTPPQQQVSSPENSTEDEDKPYTIRVVKRRSL